MHLPTLAASLIHSLGAIVRRRTTRPTGLIRGTRVATAWLLPLLIVTTGLLARAPALEFLDACANYTSGSGSDYLADAAEAAPPCLVDASLPAGLEDGQQSEYSEAQSFEFGVGCSSYEPCDLGTQPGSSEESDFASPGLGRALRDSVTPGADYISTLHVRELNHRIQSGETISEVLDWASVSLTQAEDWVRATRKVYDFNRIRIGQEVSLVVDTWSNALLRLSVEIDPRNRVVAERQDGRVVARLESIQHDRRLRVRTGTIDSSLYEAAVAVGLPQKIILDSAEILSGELDLGRDLRSGASFRVIYEELTRGDDPPIPDRVLAIEIKNRGRSHEAFYFATPDGTEAGYYDRQGKAVGLAFLRYPVAYSRISSRFSNGRFHPILRRRVPHYGVDFAAGRGTPVKAIADGTVRKAGWYGGNGRLVTIRHDSIHESGYAHLSRIAHGIRPGASVTQGQVVGYVGSSGRATGPHLHFSISRYGRYVDPLTAKLPRPRPLSDSALVAFETTVSRMERAYAKTESDPERPTRVASSKLPGALVSR